MIQTYQSSFIICTKTCLPIIILIGYLIMQSIHTTHVQIKKNNFLHTRLFDIEYFPKSKST